MTLNLMQRVFFLYILMVSRFLKNDAILNSHEGKKIMTNKCFLLYDKVIADLLSIRLWIYYHLYSRIMN